MKYRKFVTGVTGSIVNRDATGNTDLQVVEEGSVTSVTSVTGIKEELCCTESFYEGYASTCVQPLSTLQNAGNTGNTGNTLEVETVPVAETTGNKTGNKPVTSRIPLPGYAEDEMFLIEAIHGDEWLDPERNEKWAPRKQLAQTASDLAGQNVVPKEAYRMAVFAGYTGKEAGYIAKMIRDGDWRPILEDNHVMKKTDKLAALLVAA